MTPNSVFQDTQHHHIGQPNSDFQDTQHHHTGQYFLGHTASSHYIRYPTVFSRIHCIITQDNICQYTQDKCFPGQHTVNHIGKCLPGHTSHRTVFARTHIIITQDSVCHDTASSQKTVFPRTCIITQDSVSRDTASQCLPDNVNSTWGGGVAGSICSRSGSSVGFDSSLAVPDPLLVATQGKGWYYHIMICSVSAEPVVAINHMIEI